MPHNCGCNDDVWFLIFDRCTEEFQSLDYHPLLGCCWMCGQASRDWNAVLDSIDCIFLINCESSRMEKEIRKLLLFTRGLMQLRRDPPILLSFRFCLGANVMNKILFILVLMLSIAICLQAWKLNKLCKILLIFNQNYKIDCTKNISQFPSSPCRKH